MGSPVRLDRAWREEAWTSTTSIVGDPRPATVSRHVYQACRLVATVHGQPIAGYGSGDDQARAFRAAVRDLRAAAWKVLGERQPPELVDLGDAWPFPAVSDAYQRGRRRWHRISEAHALELRDAVPPRYPVGWPGFLVGEPAAHVTIDGREVAVRTAVACWRGAYYARQIVAMARDLDAALAELIELERAHRYARQYLNLDRPADVDADTVRQELAGCAVPPRPEWMPAIMAAIRQLAPEYTPNG